MKKILFPFFVLALVLACKEETKPKEIEKNPTKVYTEMYRPQYHFSPEEKWMNDPNGLVYHDGIYHLFYQFYPDDIVWGPMHWGHAISKDMMHWEHKPIALYPDEHGLIFSGSAVVDHNNTSGFAKNGETPLVAIFTYHLMEGEKAGRDDFQTQGIAYSLDNGDTWTKYENNPVIGNPGIRDFRDPKVFWHEESEQWIMALVAGDHAKFYSSADLKKWKFLSDFGKYQGAHGGVWECPDLFKLKAEGTEEEKWVLIISINPGAPNGGSGTQYFIGEFDGKRFTSNQRKPKWLDFGTDNYAGVTYNNTLNNERIFIGWMSNWDYARDTPTEKWRSAMTLPRDLSLRKEGDDFVLLNYPFGTVDSLAKKVITNGIKIPPQNKETLKVDGLNQSQIRFSTESKNFNVILKNEMGETLNLSMDTEMGAFLLDRMQSGKVDFQPEFGNKKHHMSISSLREEPYEVKIFLDWSSVEVFIDQGRYTMTQQLFPTMPYDQLIIENNDDEADILDVSIDAMDSVW
ncbi:glycoside hydrolase family 32 protein [Flagellimonas allohymeniacidonis]|uniref:Glycoside hydrolase family 32 protein n=1 Tax=Flagellimonas allohymeniacidonis TaxID=2517819 RepID=A0A4Q8QIJ8_9FLAO|nr:glycoside hydrolase family 32 protein [Allomuricauda hymeniacidonis]TAI48026.1 glycoside hydrolase family 32 protein [Allomuricauda hymeniacidonis]